MTSHPSLDEKILSKLIEFLNFNLGTLAEKNWIQSLKKIEYKQYPIAENGYWDSFHNFKLLDENGNEVLIDLDYLLGSEDWKITINGKLWNESHIITQRSHETFEVFPGSLSESEFAHIIILILLYFEDGTEAFCAVYDHLDDRYCDNNHFQGYYHF